MTSAYRLKRPPREREGDGDPPATGSQSSREATSKWYRGEHALAGSQESDQQGYFVVLGLGLIYAVVSTVFRML